MKEANISVWIRDWVCFARTLNRLHRRVGGDLHIRRTVEGGASVAAGHGGDGREHVVLNKRTRNGDADLKEDTGLDGRDDAGNRFKQIRRAEKRRSSLLGGVLNLVRVLLGTGNKTRVGSNAIDGTTEKLLEIPLLGCSRGHVNAASTQRLLKLNVNQLVRLLIV